MLKSCHLQSPIIIHDKQSVNASQSFSTKLSWLSNFIFWLRTLQHSSKIAKKLTSLFKRLHGVQLTNYILKKNRTQRQGVNLLDPTLSEQDVLRIRTFYNEDIGRLTTDHRLAVPKEWLYQS